MTIKKPTLILDKTRCINNIKQMTNKAQKNGLMFRPHFKTHQSLEIGRWYKEFGINKITVSSVTMAEYFSAEWNDITIAFPINILEIDNINKLANKITLNLIVESVEVVEYLVKNVSHNIGFFIKIDVGYRRTGLYPDDLNNIDRILNITKHSSKINFKGFLGHAGHTYTCRNKEQILQIHEESKKIMKELKDLYKERYNDLIISLGDTPSCSVAENFTGIDEIRPGNFVFYDLKQVQIGSTTTNNIAVAVVCPIVAIHKDREEIVIYGGGVHFSKEYLEDENYGTIYGKAVKYNNNKLEDLIPNVYLKKISQEHGIISVPSAQISNYNIGDLITILPVHSCMTANLLKSYYYDSSTVIDRL